MLRHSDRPILSRLLGLLVLSSLCSAMLVPNSTSIEHSEEDGSTIDPNTHHWPDTDEDELTESPEDNLPVSPVTRGGQLPGVFPWPPNDNITNDPDGLRMLGGINTGLPPFSESEICDMLMNQLVPPPMEQLPFFCFCLRCKGTVGPKGDHGDRGPPGAPGSPGKRGLTGFKGRAGFTGSQGIKGQKGDLGEKGQTGAFGFTGMKGERGFKGDKGDRGLVGPGGPQGPQGETGTCPASCDSVQGPSGVPGIPGPAGARGLPGVQGPVGPKGFVGDKGDMGRPGDPGFNGQKGNQGAQGVCECTDGVNGKDGKTGEKGAKGDKGDTGAQGVQGPMGLKGNLGNMGLMGPPGPCSPAIQSAFAACINQSFPAHNLPVPFPHVLSNQQGHFDPLMGIYTAPINGTYVFNFHLAVGQKTLKVGLFLNFYPLVRNTEAVTQATTSQSVVLHLAMGDRVWLQVKNTNFNGMFTDSESSSTFSGYLLYPDSCELPMGRDFSPTKHPPHNETFSWDGPPAPTTATPV